MGYLLYLTVLLVSLDFSFAYANPFGQGPRTSQSQETQTTTENAGFTRDLFIHPIKQTDFTNDAEYSAKLKKTREHWEKYAKNGSHCFSDSDKAEQCCSASGALSCAFGREDSEDDSVEMVLSMASAFTSTGAAGSVAGVFGACQVRSCVSPA